MKYFFTKVLVTLTAVCSFSHASFAAGQNKSSFKYNNESPTVEYAKYSLAGTVAGIGLSVVGAPKLGATVAGLSQVAGLAGYAVNFHKDHESITTDMQRSAQVGRGLTTVSTGIVLGTFGGVLGLAAGIDKENNTINPVASLIGMGVGATAMGAIGATGGYIGHTVVGGIQGGFLSLIHKIIQG